MTGRGGRLTVLLVLLSVSGEWCAAQRPADALSAQSLARQAAGALFVRSDLERARELATRALQQDHTSAEALFVAMEAAALQADTSAEIDAAVRLCETRSADQRVAVAAARLLALAANSSAFRAVGPRLRALISAASPQAAVLRAALLAAAADGLPGAALLQLARESGIITDWRIAGPFGRFGNVDFERSWPPERDALEGNKYGATAVERFRFEDGAVSLPDYFARGGVFYAAADLDVPSAPRWNVTVESTGTVELLLDGVRVVSRDDRFRALPATVSSQLKLAPGRHRLLVKFLPSALPFRIAVSPWQSAPPARSSVPQSPAESRYLAAAARYWGGDYVGALAVLGPHSDRLAASFQFLRAEAWAHLDSGTSEEFTALNAVLETAPAALAAEIKLAARAYSADRLDEAVMRLNRVLPVRPDSLPTQELRFQLAVRMHWQAEGSAAMEARLGLHSSCAALRDASKFFSAAAQYYRVADVEASMRDCAPGSLAYAEALADAGRHSDAARAAATVLSARPLDRRARAFLVGELRLEGDFPAAQNQAQELASLAPNSEGFRRLAERASGSRPAVFADSETRAARFDSGQTFYSPFQRDGLALVRDTARRRFSGGPAVVLLNDRVVRVRAGGITDVYVHKLTRVLNRDGIEQYGEVAVPDGADLIELRTIKTDGAVAEPEFSAHKATVSMPALSPEDVIEQEYVTHYPAGTFQHSSSGRFEFGSFAAPILYSRLAVISPAASPAFTHASLSAPEVQVSTRHGEEVRVWEKNDMAQSVEELAMPQRGLLPSVEVDALPVGSWSDVRDYYRDLILDVTRAGARVEQTADSMSGAPEAKARALYRFVTTRIRGGASTLDATLASAEDTLGARQGSRTATLLGVAQAAGIHADLLLARDLGSPTLSQPSIAAYTRPLVRLTLPQASGSALEAVVDAESEGVAFGALPPGLDRTRALLVPLTADAGDAPLFVSLPAMSDSERSLAQGDLTLDADGNLSAKVEITLGSWRGAQMRSVLRGIAPAGRPHFFDQLALRVFPGATGVSGEVRNENDFERPLELRISCRAGHAISFNGRWADMDQLVPALSLRKMYVGAGERRFPIYIDAPFIETARFRIHLPAGVSVSQAAADFSADNQFGSYSLLFRQGSQMIEVTRSFRIPVQIVAAAQYPEFAAFAARVDEAERERIMLERASTTAARR